MKLDQIEFIASLAGVMLFSFMAGLAIARKVGV